MTKPILLVVAGCNGSGKSTFSKLIAREEFEPFDYGFWFLHHYRKLPESELRERMAHNLAFEELNKQVENALKHGQNFCYETNFNSDPLYWPSIFKENQYEVRMLFFCLDSVSEAKRRVAIRVQNGGHFVPDTEIENRYFQGFENFNDCFSYFDLIDVFDSSAYGREPQYLFSVEKSVPIINNEIPEFLVKLIPEILN